MPDLLTPAEIRAIRDAHGYTQAEFAAVLDVNITTVQRWEWGEREPGGAACTLLRRLRDDAGRPAGA